jgi:hypothetical protein
VPASKKPSFRKLTPIHKLVLTIWTLAVMLFAFMLFRGAGGQIRMAAVVLFGVIGGILFGLNILRKIDGFLVGLGLVPSEEAEAESTGKRPTLEDLLTFLKIHRRKGHFTKTDFAKWCEKEQFPADTMLKVALGRGLIHDRDGIFVISSAGEDLLEKQGG